MDNSGKPIRDEPISAEAVIPQSPSKTDCFAETAALFEIPAALTELSDVSELVLPPEPRTPPIIGVTTNIISNQNQTLL